MKKILLQIIAFTLCIGSFAEKTSDFIKLTPVTLSPGNEKEAFFDVILDGKDNNFYSGYNMDIHLPEGVAVNIYKGELDVSLIKNDDGVYPYEEDREGNKTFTHSVSSSFNEIGAGVLRVACISTSNKAFTKTSGKLFRVYVKASSFVKPGIQDITIDGVTLKVADGASYYPDSRIDNNISVSTSAQASLNVSSANHWSTCILPFTATVPEGVKAYTVSSYDTENLNLKEEKTMEAYTPYILYSKDGYSGTLSGTVDASGYPEKGYTDGSVLKGAIVAQTVKNGYVMQKQDDGVMFYKIAEGDSFSVPAGKCWLELPESSARSLSFTFEDETGIDTVRPAVKTSDIYLIDGRRVSEPQPGKLYIKGGAKYVKQ